MTDTPNNEVTIRAAVDADVPQVEKLIQPFVAQRKLLFRSIDEIAKLMQHGFAAECAGRIVGFAAVEIYSRKMAELQCMAVAESFQGRGIGKQLVQRCVERASEQGVHELMAITASDEMFKSCGFNYALPDQKRALFIHTGPPT